MMPHRPTIVGAGTSGPTTPDDWLDNANLSTAEKGLLEARIADFEQHPEASIPWAVAEEQLKHRYGG